MSRMSSSTVRSVRRASEAILEERGPEPLLEPDEIARSYLMLHRQERSAWTLELDLRPWVERF